MMRNQKHVETMPTAPTGNAGTDWARSNSSLTLSNAGYRQTTGLPTRDSSDYWKPTASPCFPSHGSNQTRKALRTGMPGQSSTTHRDPFSPEHIRATWSGTASVEDAAQAFGLSRSKSYDLVRRGEFPCRTADRPYHPRRHRLAPPGTRKRRAGVQHSLQRKHQAVLTNCTRTPRRSKPTLLGKSCVLPDSSGRTQRCEGGATGGGERFAAEPGVDADQIDGGAREEMVQVRLGKAPIARPSYPEGVDRLPNGPLHPSPTVIALFPFRGVLLRREPLEKLVLGPGSQGEVAAGGRCGALLAQKAWPAVTGANLRRATGVPRWLNPSYQLVLVRPLGQVARFPSQSIVKWVLSKPVCSLVFQLVSRARGPSSSRP